MPPWFIDIESATEAEAKSNGTPPASRTAAHASRTNAPSSALQGVMRESVEATPTNGFWKSASFRPRAWRNARCGARSSPSTVMRDGSFFVLTHDFLDVLALREAKGGASCGKGRLGRTVHDRLQRRLGLEAHPARRPGLHCVPHLPPARADAVAQQRAARADLCRRKRERVQDRLHDLADGYARQAGPGRYRANIVAAGERLADDRARPARHRGVGAAGPHQHRRQAQRAAVDVAAPGVVVDQDLAHQLLRAIGESRRCGSFIIDLLNPTVNGDG